MLVEEATGIVPFDADIVGTGKKGCVASQEVRYWWWGGDVDSAIVKQQLRQMNCWIVITANHNDTCQTDLQQVKLPLITVPLCWERDSATMSNREIYTGKEKYSLMGQHRVCLLETKDQTRLEVEDASIVIVTKTLTLINHPVQVPWVQGEGCSCCHEPTITCK